MSHQQQVPPGSPRSKEDSKLYQHYSQSRDSHEHVLITWENIDYSVLANDPSASKFLRPVLKNKKILRSMSGSAESGQLLAIMGPTGSLLFC
jgi:ABC-type multidrug transport system ATPase subunit